MQILAKTINNKIIHVYEAQKQVDYLCPECLGILHKRAGHLNQEHFYHVRSETLCRQSNKSQEHLNTQLYIFNLFESNTCLLEKRFDSINRVADIFVEDLNLVIEVQCSYIPLIELKERIKDYQKLGLHIVWIFHDKRFNKKIKTESEKYLKEKTHFYTNIDAKGEGMIYDQYHFLKKRKVFLNKTLYNSKLSFFSLKIVKKRKQHLPFYFSGDIVDCLLNSANPLLIKNIKRLETTHNPSLIFSILKIFKGLFYLKLEQACR
jgi:competence CoiA-like predicted nuclease